MRAMARTEDIDKKDMGKVYDQGAQAFLDEGERLLTYKFIVGPAVDKAVAGIKNKAEAQVVDQGCGVGRIIKRLVQNGFSPKNITGIEISQEEVNITKGRFPDANIIQGHLTSVELPSDSQDLVTQSMVAEHLSDEELLKTSKNAVDALKSGGEYFVICTHPDSTAAKSGLKESGSFMTKFPWGGEGLNYHRTKQRFGEIFKEAGFVIDSVEDLKMPPEAKKDDSEEYVKQKAKGNTRIAFIMHKPAK